MPGMRERAEEKAAKGVVSATAKRVSNKLGRASSRSSRGGRSTDNETSGGENDSKKKSKLLSLGERNNNRGKRARIKEVITRKRTDSDASDKSSKHSRSRKNSDDSKKDQDDEGKSSKAKKLLGKKKKKKEAGSDEDAVDGDMGGGAAKGFVSAETDGGSTESQYDDIQQDSEAGGLDGGSGATTSGGDDGAPESGAAGGGSYDDKSVGSGFTTDTDAASSGTGVSDAGGDNYKKKKKRKGEDVEGGRQQLEEEAALVASSASQMVQIRVKIVEAMELQGTDLNPVCRVFLKGKVRTTRTRRSTTEPKFNQMVCFKIRSSMEKLVTEEIEFKVYDARRLMKDALLGMRKVGLGMVFHQQRHSVINQWLPLTLNSEDQNDDNDIVGFLRVSISVIPPGASGPVFPEPGPMDNDVLHGFNLQYYTLQVGIYSMSDLPAHVTKKQKKKNAAPSIGIRAVLGKQQIESEPIPVVGDAAHFGQVLQLPIMWPSVIKDLHLQLLCPALDKAPVLRRRWFHKDDNQLAYVPPVATAPLSLKEISNAERGNAGFLPTFGPAFISFYGAERKLYQSRHGKEKKDRRVIGTAIYEGSAFYGRLLVEVQCLAKNIKRPVSFPLGAPELAMLDGYRKRDCFTLFTSFFAANMIHTDFRDDAISFEVTMGSNAGISADDDPGSSARSRTVGVLPTFDHQNYYCMPWGANKPSCDLTLTFENFTYRMKEKNYLNRMIEKLRDNAKVATAMFETCPEQAYWASILIETYEEIYCTLKSVIDDERQSATKRPKTVLDHRIKERRVEHLTSLLDKLKCEPWESASYEDAGSEYTQRLVGYANELTRLADDPQTSIPDVLIRMLAGDKVVGFCKVPIADVLFCPNEFERGVKVGKLVSEVLKWTTPTEHRRRSPEVPALVHLRLWFGAYEQRKAWKLYLPAANMRYFAEIFENQKSDGRSMRPRYSDELGVNFAKGRDAIDPPADWQWNEEWRVQRTFDMYVVRDADRTSFEHHAYEIEYREVNKWRPLLAPADGQQLFTDAAGHRVDNLTQLVLPPGWVWADRPKVDLRALGDDKGWVYSSTNQFPVHSQCDTEQRSHHVYRRRKLYRIRLRDPKSAASAAAPSSAGADLETYTDPEDEKGGRSNVGWEYSGGFGKPAHLTKGPGDKMRRRRWVREIIVTALDAKQQSLEDNFDFNPYRRPIMGIGSKGASASESPVVTDSEDGQRRLERLLPLSSLYPRAYIVYNRQEVSRWQLRAYILWARDLFPAAKKGVAHAFCRVSFMNRCKDTYVVRGSINPIWNETVIFDRMLICMDGHSMSESPPHALVEVFSHNMEAAPEFIGRMMARPYVWFRGKSDEMSLASRLYGGWQWYPLEFAPNQHRGALLAMFQLFKADNQQDLPPPPIAKPKPLETRFEIPPSMRPKFIKLDIQVLCWGVRNLGRYQLAAINHPFVEVVMGEYEVRTLPLDDAKRNPNFAQPIITLRDVMVPERFDLARPVLINLYDRRSFGRQPLVGVCMIKDFRRYVTQRSSRQRGDDDEAAWRELERRLHEAQAENVQAVVALAKIDQKKKKDSDQIEDDEMMVEEFRHPEIDWWSKYYASTGDGEDAAKAPGYVDSGLATLTVVDCPLEDYRDYNGFNDFVETFEFRKMKKGNFNEPDKTDYRGELKGRLYIYKQPPESEDEEDEAKKEPNKEAKEGEKKEEKDGEKKSEKAGEKKDENAGVAKKKKKESHLEMTLPPGIAFAGPVDCLVRVYIIRALNLASRRRSGRCDPYVDVRCGKKNKKSLKKEYIPDTLEPIFGQLVEFSITLPQDKDLMIMVKDKRLITADEELGSTTIDLENRLLTKHRATVGLPKRYDVGGPNQWRDQMPPLEQLNSYCRIHQIDPPRVSEKLDSIEILGRRFTADVCKTDKGTALKYRGPPVQQIALHILRLAGLVPEHVERRALFNRFLDNDSEQGLLEMFVDLFPRPLGAIPPPLQIAPRTPLPFQLRIVIWNLRDVIQDGCSSVSGEKYQDLFVKIFVGGQAKAQKTDVHYQCRDGAASFNYRMLFNLEYDPWQRKIVVRRRARLFRKKITESVDPELVIQIWDNNKFKRNHYIGQIRMNLLAIEEAQPAEEEMVNVWEPVREQDKESRCPCCRTFCWICTCGYVNHKKNVRKKGCCVRKHVAKKPPPPRHYISGKTAERSVVNEQRTVKGWWPATATGERKQGTQVTAKLEMEMDLLPMKLAEKNPVGKARKEPNHSPVLPKPVRPHGDSFWLTSRMKICWKWTGNQTWIKATLIAIVLILLLVLLAYIFIGDIPEMVFGTDGII